MDPVILMVGRVNEGVHDIEVMPDVIAADLADAIALAFGWQGTYDIQVAGKMLGTHQTLAEADIWDGSQLMLVSSNRPPRPATISVQQAVAGLRSLRVPARSSLEPAAPVGSRRRLKTPNASSAVSANSLPLQVSTPSAPPSVTQDGSPVRGKRALQIPDSPASEANPNLVNSWQPIIPEHLTQTPLSSPVTAWRQTTAAPESPKDDDSQP